MKRVPLQQMARHAHGLQPVGLRTGTTLTEVLMALLVMSVGILSVMSLFPIAYLRSVQGTQLTNATILKMRADSQVDMFGLVTDRFIPQPIEGDVTRCLIDPLAWQDIAAGLDATTFPYANANQYGVDGALARLRYAPRNVPTALGGNQQQPTRFINAIGQDAVDQWPMPLRRLGFPNAAVPVGGIMGVPLRVRGGTIPYSVGNTNVFSNRNAALSAVALPDTLETQLTAVPLSNTAIQVTFDTANVVDPGDLTYLEGLFNSGIPLRLTLINVTGKQSQTRTISNSLLPAVLPPPAINVGAGTIGWATDQPLPQSFVPPSGGLSEVRVETTDPRYSWMLTVRKKGISGGSVTEIDCVVFFNRATEDPEEELVHNAVIPDPAAVVPIPPEDAAYTGTVSFTAYPSDANRVPPLRKGGYVFDPTHAEWYRVQDILSETATDAVIRLDRRPEQQIPTLVVPRGVIHVFPMKPRVDASGRKLGF